MGKLKVNLQRDIVGCGHGWGRGFCFPMGRDQHALVRSSSTSEEGGQPAVRCAEFDVMPTLTLPEPLWCFPLEHLEAAPLGLA